MNDRDRTVYETSVNALAFLKGNKADFPGIPAITQAISTLETETPEIADLGEAKVSTTGGAKDATIHRGDSRDALRDAMEDIAAMWRPMAKNYENAQHKFRMPNGSDQLLIDTAGSFIEEATPLETAFTARGMPTDFITELTAKRDAFAESIVESDTAVVERVGVNAGFKDPVTECREAIEDVDPIVKMVYRNNPSKLAEWLTASHFKRSR